MKAPSSESNTSEVLTMTLPEPERVGNAKLPSIVGRYAYRLNPTRHVGPGQGGVLVCARACCTPNPASASETTATRDHLHMFIQTPMRAGRHTRSARLASANSRRFRAGSLCISRHIPEAVEEPLGRVRCALTRTQRRFSV